MDKSFVQDHVKYKINELLFEWLPETCTIKDTDEVSAEMFDKIVSYWTDEMNEE